MQVCDRRKNCPTFNLNINVGFNVILLCKMSDENLSILMKMIVLRLLVGAPNETHRRIQGHGLLHECTVTLKRNETCKVIDTSGASNKCSK
jgi:hypothetical protein